MSQHQNSQTSPNGGDSPHGTYGYPPQTYLKEEKPINWRRYLFIFLRNWYLFLITIGIALGIAFFKIRYTIPVFESKATLIIEEDENRQDVVSEMRAIRYWRRQTDMANERAKISSFTTIKRTVDSLDQKIFWTAYGRIRVRPLYKCPRYELNLLNDSTDWYKRRTWYVDYVDDENFRLYYEGYMDTLLQLNTKIEIQGWKFRMSLIGESGHNTYSFIINDPVALTKTYKGKLQIETDNEAGTVVTLKSHGTVGEREADFLNTLSQSYIHSGLERKQKIAANTFIFIDEQINVILDSLNQAEQQLLLFRLSNNVINLSKEGEIAYDRLKSFHEQLTQLRLKTNYYNYLYKYIEDRHDPQTIIAPSLSDPNDQLLISAVQELQQLYEERETLDISANTNNPGLESINDRIIGVRLRILEIVRGLIKNNQLTMEQVETEEQAIINQLKTLPLNEQQLLNIKRKYDLYNQFYTFLLEKRAEAGIQKASTISNIRILDPARYDELTLLGGDKKISLLIAILLGILLPGGFLLLRSVLDGRIREREDIVNNTNIPIIGIIGHAHDTGTLPVIENPKSAFSESLRRIRTNLAFAMREKGHKVIMVTSSISGEGKTFSAANIATILAMNNRKVLLVGLDLRRPTLHRIFNASNSSGLTSCLIGEKKPSEVILSTSVDNLFLLPSGPIPPNPAELIETTDMRDMLLKFREEYDYIIIDTPPIALVSDAMVAGKYSDLTLYLVRQDHSHKSVLSFANSMQEEEKLPKTYLLINDIRPSKSMGMYYYYGYGKGYNYGYYDYRYSSTYYTDKD